MKACQIMEELFALAPKCANMARTCDTLKAGDPEREVTRAAVAMFATPEVIREAAAWGAELLIVHEPTYYNHWDEHSENWLELEKRKLIEASGLTIYRYHDHPHMAEADDMIALGELAMFAPNAKLCPIGKLGQNRITLPEAVTPRELARTLEEKLNIGHIRIAGAADVPCTRVTCLFGSPGGVMEELSVPESEILLVGETCEWRDLEFARDAAQLGYQKAVLVLGHVGSERDGMTYTAQVLSTMHPELAVRYFECGEVYTYADR